MLRRLQDGARGCMTEVKVASGIKLGLIGGLVGSVVMDLVMLGTFSMTGEPAGVFFAFIGEAAAAFLSMIGISVGGGYILIGAGLHYVIGLVLGIIFVGIVSRVDALRAAAVWKCVLLGILYTEVASFLLLVPAVIVLKMTASQIRELFAAAFFFHLVYGAVLGVIVSYGLRSRISGERNKRARR